MAENNLTLDALKTDAVDTTPAETTKSEIKEVSINTIAPPKETDPNAPPVEGDILGAALYNLPTAIERAKKDMYENLIEPKLEEMAEAEMDREINGEDADDDTPVNNTIIKMAPKVVEEGEMDASEVFSDTETTTSFTDDDDEDFEKLLGLNEDDETSEEEEAEAEAEKERVEGLKQQIKDNLKPIKKSLDLSKFTISKKPISVTKILNNPAAVTIKTADWVMLNSKKAFSMSELGGAEIEKFNPNRRERNPVNLLKERYSIMYDHLIDDNKPATLEAWLKTIAFTDNKDLFFGAYKATFQDTNIIPYNCTECKHIFMENKDIDEMVKYPSDDIKAKVEAIRRGDTTSVGEYEATLVQASDNYAVAIKTPTVYSVIIESSVLDESFASKYSDIIAMISYIDDIYLIDEESQELKRIDYKPIPTDFEKTTKRKILAYSKILKQLTSDQTQNLLLEMKKLDNEDSEITYITPATTCPKCGAKIKEEERDPQSLLFTRHQLVAFSNM